MTQGLARALAHPVGDTADLIAAEIGLRVLGAALPLEVLRHRRCRVPSAHGGKARVVRKSSDPAKPRRLHVQGHRLQGGELWGNLPEPCSRVGLMPQAMRSSKSWEEALWRAS